MSVSKWAWTEECEGKPCCGECDICTDRPGERYTKPTVFNAVTAMSKICLLETKLEHYEKRIAQLEQENKFLKGGKEADI